MKKQYQYILFFLLFIIIYEMYLIANYKYRDFESNNYLDQVQKESASIKKIIEDKKQYLEFIRTNAYQDLISKANQNKKHSFEGVVLLVSESEKNSYEPMDTDKQIATLSQQIPKKITDGMSNPEKWIYYIFHKNLRLE